MKPQQVTDALKLNQLKDKIWFVVPSCATSGEGLLEGLVGVLLTPLPLLVYRIWDFTFLVCLRRTRTDCWTTYRHGSRITLNLHPTPPRNKHLPTTFLTTSSVPQHAILAEQGKRNLERKTKRKNAGDLVLLRQSILFPFGSWGVVATTS